MRNKIIYLILSSWLIATAGCKKLLEKEPDNRAKLNSPEKVAQLLATAYPYGNYMTFAETSSDNAGDRGSGITDNTLMDAYMFRDIRSTQQDSPEFYWHSCYAAIAAANEALEAIREQGADSVKYTDQKGEALVCRAYAHFMLVNFFSKFYSASTAATDPGIPYVTEPENVVVKQYDRKTVKYVYDRVEKDLLAGIPLLKDDAYTVPAYHFTTVAAHAFAARFYLFKGDFARVLTHTAFVVPATGIASRLRPWNTAYAGLTRLELFARYQKATEPANLLLAETISDHYRYTIAGRYGFDLTAARATIANVPAIANSSVTAEWSFINQTYGGDNTVYIPKVNEYFVRRSVNADIGTAYVMVPLFTMEEALFSRAEAFVYVNNTAAAIDLLNIYLGTRINNYNPAIHTLTGPKAMTYYSTTNLQLALINLIIDYRQAEFIHEGMRWFDILRYDIPVQHLLEDGTTITLAAGSKQRLFQLPQSVTLSGLALNPR
ncbi:MAG TPA: RagB/SusD family nutrient uptake outer membrane protein [Chitinophagaceae bacterium]|nr:RagB/SusD family nutrient uptake outer membrane protein [Chitinophagaceae bacterium]